MNKGTYWFDRFKRDAEALSPHIRFVSIAHGFYRIYWIGSGHPAYLGECYREMPEFGYEIEDLDINLVSQKYYEEFEDRTSITRKIKNFVEGYWESIDQLTTRVYMFKNDAEFRKTAINGYKQAVNK